MTGEIDGDFYCSGYNNAKFMCENYNACSNTHGSSHCVRKRHKWPTPEQFKEEYGWEVPEEMPVWVLNRSVAILKRFDGTPYEDIYKWSLHTYGTFKERISDWNSPFKNMVANFGQLYIEAVVCACTPWGKPPNDWRP